MAYMHNEELLYYSLKRISTTIERIINNSKMSLKINFPTCFQL